MISKAKRPRALRTVIALGVTASFALAACGSD